MLNLALIYILTAATGALAAFVGVRAWTYPPARLFTLVCASLLLVRLLGDLRDLAPDERLVQTLAALSLAAIAVLELSLLLLFAALFAPEWFKGRRPIFWIGLPYALAALLLAADGTLGLGLIFAGLRETEAGPRLAPAPPGSTVMLAAFTLSWLIHLAILGAAFARQPGSRGSIGFLGTALVLAMLAGFFTTGGVIQALPIIGALAYMVLRTRLLLPTRAGIDTAVRAMDDAVIVLDQAGAPTYANPAALALALDRPEDLGVVLTAGDGGRALIGGRELRLRRTELDDGGRLIGTLLIARDVTELEQRERELEAERARLAATVERLTAAQAERAELAQTVQQLTMPLIPVLPGVLILPLVGALDGPRLAEFTTTLLEGVERERARLVLLDITGLPLLDTAAAAGLLRGVQAAALLGARCVLVGVRPEIAQSLVGLGIDLGEVGTASTLQQALLRELRLMTTSA